MSQELLKSIQTNEAEHPEVKPGDMVSVYLRIKEGANERTQEFKGTVIRVRNGDSANFTVRRVASNGIGVERTFMMHSPRVEKIEIHRHSHVRRSKLYFLRDRTGKRARLKQKFNV